MNPFMNPSLFASLSYHKTYNFSQAQAGKSINPPLMEGMIIILPWAVEKKKEARDEAREEAYNRL